MAVLADARSTSANAKCSTGWCERSSTIMATISTA
jgi:hypothetical protein